MLPFVIAHTFCTSRDGLRNSVFLRMVLTNICKGILAPLEAMRKKQILAKAIVIQKEIRCNLAFFRGN